MVFRGIRTKRLECGEDNEDRRPAVVKRDWEMNEKLIKFIRRRVGLLDDVVDVLTGVLSGATSRSAQFGSKTYRDGRADKEREEECYIFLVLDGHARLPRGLHASTYQLHSVAWTKVSHKQH